MASWSWEVAHKRHVHDFYFDKHLSLGVTRSILNRWSRGVFRLIRDHNAIWFESVVELLLVKVGLANPSCGDQVGMQSVLGVVRGVVTPKAIVGERVPKLPFI